MKRMRGMSMSTEEAIPCPLCGCRYMRGGGMATHMKSCQKEIAIGVKRLRGVTWRYSPALRKWVKDDTPPRLTR